MDHHGQTEFRREFQLLLENDRLFCFCRAVQNGRIQICCGFVAQRHRGDCFLMHSGTRQAMIIQAALAEPDDARMLCQGTQRCDCILWRIVRVGWMNPDSRKYLRVRFRQRNCAL